MAQGEHSYKREICLKAYASGSDLRKHTKGHTEVNPYKCELCPETFVYKNMVNRHMIACTEEQPKHLKVESI